MENTTNRRPLKTREYNWPHRLAHYCVSAGITPNQISLASILCALIGALMYWGSTTGNAFISGLFLILAAVCIQLRLLSNMLDGLMAVEEGKKTADGVIYNELPDRAADAIFLIAAGCASHWAWLGWLAALLAVSTAYVRAFGGALGYAQDFQGPMAKPHRMFALTVGSIVAAFFAREAVLSLTLIIIVIGCVVTLARRTQHIAQKLSDDHVA